MIRAAVGKKRARKLDADASGLDANARGRSNFSLAPDREVLREPGSQTHRYPNPPLLGGRCESVNDASNGHFP